MYSQHFGLTQDPFSIAPDPRYLFMSERHREALAHLLYGVGGPGRVAGGGFVLLTGDIGTGKTTICRCFLEQIPAGCHVAYIFNPKLTVTELLQSVCEEFHIDTTTIRAQTPTVKDYIDALNAFLLQSHAKAESCILIIDEAQNLASDVLEQLRLLTNLETSERKLLQIVLIGQPELRNMLARPELEQLAQRVIARFHLDALDAKESLRYIQHRLAIAGHLGELPFDKRAVQHIHQLARGVPRRINLLCGRSLLGAWANGLHRVDRQVVKKAASEVFGDEKVVARGPIRGPLAAALTVMLLAAAALGTFLLWSGSPAAPVALENKAATPPTMPPETVASAPVATTSMPLVTPPAASAPLEDIEPLVNTLARDVHAAWRALASHTNVSITDADPCKGPPSQTMQCARTGDLTLPQLRQLDRPGILTLQMRGSAPWYALLVSMDSQAATLQIGPLQHRVRLTSLVKLWRGEFATYWQPPPGYIVGLPLGSQGEAVDWLNRQLASIEGVRPPSGMPRSGATMDEALRERVRAFQRAQGLKPDGQPGPMTFMQLESAIAVPVPRIPTETR